MTIKLRLGLSFIAMILLVSIVGAFFMYSGSIRAKYYESAILATRISGLAKEMNYFFDQQLRSFDYYVLFNEAMSKEDYNDYKKTVVRKFYEWNNLLPASDKESVGEIKHLETIYTDVMSSADDVLDFKSKGFSSKALSVVDKIYTPKSKQLRSEIEGIVKNKELTAAVSQMESEKIAARQVWASFVVIIFSVVFGLALSYYIFSYISRPLYQLQKGAEEFGTGNFDYNLELANSENEFGKLARSFNEMCENIRKMQSQIIQLDRMSAMGQLAGGVAHELNNPLTGVLGQSQIMLQSCLQMTQ
jgi:nitrogen fixation/metabolism regulation signal transduction histidine kinase